eukprot:Skav207803  [mRNA]  locus=scaffold381:49411:61915:+ [translate_table: standard]
MPSHVICHPQDGDLFHIDVERIGPADIEAVDPVSFMQQQLSGSGRHVPEESDNDLPPGPVDCIPQDSEPSITWPSTFAPDIVKVLLPITGELASSYEPDNIPLKTWFLHHRYGVYCKTARTVMLSREVQTWEETLRSTWRDQARPDEPLHIHRVTPTPADDRSHPPTVHILISQGDNEARDRRGLLIGMKAEEDFTLWAVSAIHPARAENLIWYINGFDYCSPAYDGWACTVWRHHQQLIPTVAYDFLDGEFLRVEATRRSSPRPAGEPQMAMDEDVTNSEASSFIQIASQQRRIISLEHLLRDPDQEHQAGQDAILREPAGHLVAFLVDSDRRCQTLPPWVELPELSEEACQQVLHRDWNYSGLCCQLHVWPAFAVWVPDAHSLLWFYVPVETWHIESVVHRRTPVKFSPSDVDHMSFLHGRGFNRAVIIDTLQPQQQVRIVLYHNNVPELAAYASSKKKTRTPWPSRQPRTSAAPFFRGIPHDQDDHHHLATPFTQDNLTDFFASGHGALCRHWEHLTLPDHVRQALSSCEAVDGPFCWDHFDRLIIFTDGSSKPANRHRSPAYNEDVGANDTWAYLVLAENYELDQKYFLGWAAHSVVYNVHMTHHLGADRMGADIAELEALSWAGLWRLSCNTRLPTVFCADSSYALGQAGGTHGCSTVSTLHRTLRAIFQALQMAVESDSVWLYHVNSHTDDPFNDFVDVVANAERQQGQHLGRQKLDMRQWSPRLPFLWMVFADKAGLPALTSRGFRTTRPGPAPSVETSSPSSVQSSPSSSTSKFSGSLSMASVLGLLRGHAYTVPSAAPDPVPPCADFFGCLTCAKQFKTRGGQGAHMFRSHGQVDPCRTLFNGTACGACLREYFTFDKLKAHLRHSDPCRQTLWGRHLQLTPAPGRGSRENSELAHRHAGLCPVTQGLGPLPSPGPLRDFDPVHYPLHTELSNLLIDELPLVELEAMVQSRVQRHTISWTTWRATLAQLQQDYGEREAELAGYTQEDFAQLCNRLATPQRWPWNNSQELLSPTPIEDFYVQEQIFIDIASRECGLRPQHPTIPRGVGRVRYLLHAFSGRRRYGDVQYFLDALALRHHDCRIEVLSIDLIIDRELCDLANPATQTMWHEAMAAGWIVGILAGPPCNTWSRARNRRLSTLSSGGFAVTGPRPVRDALHPWGKTSCSLRELESIIEGNNLMLFVLKALYILYIQGNVGLMEHPAFLPQPEDVPLDQQPASIWKVPLLAALLRCEGVQLIQVAQGVFGSESQKPTSLLAMNLEDLPEELQKWHITSQSWQETSVGLNSSGFFNSARLKEYPPAMCAAFASTLDRAIASLPFDCQQSMPTHFRAACRSPRCQVANWTMPLSSHGAMPPSLWSELMIDNEILGATSPDIAVHVCGRFNILVGDPIDEGNHQFSVTHFRPTGTSAGAAVHSYMTWDDFKAIGTKKMIWKSPVSIPSGKFWLLQAREYPDFSKGVDFIVDKETIVIPADRNKDDSTLRVLELFSGTYGGWHRALKMLKDWKDLDFQTVAIETSLPACIRYATAHGVPVINGFQTLDANFLDEFNGSLVLHADVADSRIYSCLGNWQPDLMCISSPCQPWSEAAGGPGFHNLMGLLAAESILLSKWTQPDFLALENVLGMQKHPHFPELLRTIYMAGYQKVWSGPIDLASIAPVKRPRWLALFKKVGSPAINELSFQPWEHTNQHGPIQHGTVLFTDDVADPQLVITDKIRAIVSNPSLLPGRRSTRVTPKQAFDERCHNGWQILPCFLASYGQQHLFNDVSKHDRGCLAHYARIGGAAARHWHPAEVALHHGLYGPLLLSDDFIESWEGLGNQIAVPHAAFLVVNVCQMLNKIPGDWNLAEALVFFDQHKTTNKNLVIQHTDAGLWLSDSEHDPLDTQAIQAVQDVIQRCGYGFLPTGRYSFVPNLNDEDTNMVLTLSMHPDTMQPCNLFCALVRQSFILAPLDEHTSLHTMKQDLHVHNLFDAFGEFPDGVEVAPKGGFTDFHIPHQLAIDPIVVIAAAFQATSIIFHKDADLDALTVQIQGEPAAIKTIVNLFTFAWDVSTLDALNKDLLVCTNDDHVKVSFQTKKDKGSFPPGIFAKMVAVAAFRSVIDTLKHVDGLQVRFKWLYRPLWEGSLHPELAIETLLMLIQYLLSPAAHFTPYRLVHLGKQACGGSLQDHVRSDGRLATFHLIAPQQGGTGGPPSTKTQHRQQLKNSLATSLLEQGFELGWINNHLDKMIDAVGVRNVVPVASEPPGVMRNTKIGQLFTNAGIPLPTKPSKGVTAPMNFKLRQNKKLATAPNPNEYELLCQYLLNEDDTPTKQLWEFKANTTGVLVTDEAGAAPWIRENVQLSPDELCIFVMGQCSLQIQLPSLEVVLPFFNAARQQVLVHGVLIQFGGRRLKPAKWDATDMKAASSKICAVTLWKDDWSPEEWDRAMTNTSKFIRAVAQQSGHPDAIESIWGRTLRKGKQACTIHEATSLQAHISIKKEEFMTFLSATGFNRLWAAPKNSDGRLDDSFRVLWVPHIQKDLQRATALGAQLKGMCGLILGRNTWGFRLLATSFAEGWKHVFPDNDLPEEIHTKYMFRLEPVPHGTNQMMLREWATLMSWKIRPIRPLTSRSWLVGSPDHPPKGILSWNGQPVLPTLLPPRQTQQASSIVAGPRASKDQPLKPNSTVATPVPLLGDPWAGYQPTTSGPAAARTTTGPLESRLAAQDSRIQGLEDQLTKLATAQEQQHEQLASVQHEVQGTEKRLSDQLLTAISSVKSDLSASFSQALQQQAQSFDTNMSKNMTELRNLISSVAKRKAEEGTPMQS